MVQWQQQFHKNEYIIKAELIIYETGALYTVSVAVVYLNPAK